MPEDRTIYGDGKNEVTVSPTEVVLSDGTDLVIFSRAAFREIVLGWERLQQQEDEAPA
jgi:hypothetical protein